MLCAHYADFLSTFRYLASIDKFRNNFYQKVSKVAEHAQLVYDLDQKEISAINRGVEAFKT
jgi:hypothetical protein